MKLCLYSHGYPSGRCLLLAAQLHRATTLPEGERVRLGERLFDTQFTAASPVVVEVADAAADLMRLCEGFGIKAVPVA